MWKSSGRHKHNQQTCDVSKSLKDRVLLVLTPTHTYPCTPASPWQTPPKEKKSEENNQAERICLHRRDRQKEKERDSGEREREEEETKTNKMREWRKRLTNTEAERETESDRGKPVWSPDHICEIIDHGLCFKRTQIYYFSFLLISIFRFW